MHGRNLHELKSAIPAHLFKCSNVISLQLLVRDIAMSLILAYSVLRLDAVLSCMIWEMGLLKHVCLSVPWMVYWWFQGLVLTGIWVVGHECGHGSFFTSQLFCDIVGFVCHSALWTPYFSWKITHHSHHRHHASMEKDEHWVPQTRSEALIEDSVFDDTPIVTVMLLVVQQVAGFPFYLLFNVSGQRTYPKATGHFNRKSVLFTAFSTALFHRRQRWAVIMSDLGILLMVFVVRYASIRFGGWRVFRLYGIPCLTVSHWVTMIVFLQHTDPELPHYRRSAWSFTRGALSTMDRDFLGWQGRFFLHNIAHFHVAHHLFPKMPLYHAPEATLILKGILGDQYHASSEPVFPVLWRNYHLCQFVEDHGKVAYYKDRRGQNRFLDDFVAQSGGLNTCG
ncbi:fatty acid desaturase-domain-containing protein [Desarmillaria ectypa]|nr:fatty acid desaturase-domain-containing protein [Desarmillaria ectypa]